MRITQSHKRYPYVPSPPRPDETTCVVCGRKCKSTVGLRKQILCTGTPYHRVVQLPWCRHLTLYLLCFRPCKSAAGLKSHLHGHVRWWGFRWAGRQPSVKIKQSYVYIRSTEIMYDPKGNKRKNVYFNEQDHQQLICFHINCFI